jgi:hypothetical protein
MDGHIFTTRGWVPAEQVELRESVTHDDEHVRLVRVDKYIDGEWVGNDINGQIKKGHELAIEQAQL